MSCVTFRLPETRASPCTWKSVVGKVVLIPTREFTVSTYKPSAPTAKFEAILASPITSRVDCGNSVLIPTRSLIASTCNRFVSTDKLEFV